jgi:hypothetical protein
MRARRIDRDRQQARRVRIQLPPGLVRISLVRISLGRISLSKQRAPLEPRQTSYTRTKFTLLNAPTAIAVVLSRIPIKAISEELTMSSLPALNA